MELSIQFSIGSENYNVADGLNNNQPSTTRTRKTSESSKITTIERLSNLMNEINTTMIHPTTPSAAPLITSRVRSLSHQIEQQMQIKSQIVAKNYLCNMLQTYNDNNNNNNNNDNINNTNGQLPWVATLPDHEVIGITSAPMSTRKRPKPLELSWTGPTHTTVKISNDDALFGIANAIRQRSNSKPTSPQSYNSYNSSHKSKPYPALGSKSTGRMYQYTTSTKKMLSDIMEIVQADNDDDDNDDTETKETENKYNDNNKNDNDKFINDEVLAGLQLEEALRSNATSPLGPLGIIGQLSNPDVQLNWGDAKRNNNNATNQETPSSGQQQRMRTWSIANKALARAHGKSQSRSVVTGNNYNYNYANKQSEAGNDKSLSATDRNTEDIAGETKDVDHDDGSYDPTKDVIRRIYVFAILFWWFLLHINMAYMLAFVVNYLSFGLNFGNFRENNTYHVEKIGTRLVMSLYIGRCCTLFIQSIIGDRIKYTTMVMGSIIITFLTSCLLFIIQLMWNSNQLQRYGDSYSNSNENFNIDINIGIDIKNQDTVVAILGVIFAIYGSYSAICYGSMWGMIGPVHPVKPFIVTGDTVAYALGFMVGGYGMASLFENVGYHVYPLCVVTINVIQVVLCCCLVGYHNKVIKK